MQSTSFHISKVTEQTWRVQNCSTMVHVQAVGSVRLPSEIYATQAAALPESVGGPTVRICSAKQMNQPYVIVDAEDEHECPKRECFKYLLTKSNPDTDMSSFRETCTADTQEFFGLSPALPTHLLFREALPNSKVEPKAMPKPPTGPPPAGPRPCPPGPPLAASSKASSSSTCVQPSEEPPQKVARDTCLQPSEEPPIKVQKLGNEASVAEEVTRPPVTPIGLSSLSGGAPSSADMTCPIMVAAVAAEHDAKTAQLYSPDNWADRINFRCSITTHMSICFSVLARRRAFTS